MDEVSNKVAEILLNNVRYPLYEDINTIGRNPKAVVNIKNTIISQDHAIIVILNGNHYISDMGSSNGSFINGKKLVPRKLYILENKSQFMLGNLLAIYTTEEFTVDNSQNNLKATQSQSVYEEATQLLPISNCNNTPFEEATTQIFSWSKIDDKSPHLSTSDENNEVIKTLNHNNSIKKQSPLIELNSNKNENDVKNDQNSIGKSCQMKDALTNELDEPEVNNQKSPSSNICDNKHSNSNITELNTSGRPSDHDNLTECDEDNEVSRIHDLKLCEQNKYQRSEYMLENRQINNDFYDDNLPLFENHINNDDNNRPESPIIVNTVTFHKSVEQNDDDDDELTDCENDDKRNSKNSDFQQRSISNLSKVNNDSNDSMEFTINEKSLLISRDNDIETSNTDTEESDENTVQRTRKSAYVLSTQDLMSQSNNTESLAEMLNSSDNRSEENISKQKRKSAMIISTQDLDESRQDTLNRETKSVVLLEESVNPDNDEETQIDTTIYNMLVPATQNDSGVVDIDESICIQATPARSKSQNSYKNSENTEMSEDRFRLVLSQLSSEFSEKNPNCLRETAVNDMCSNSCGVDGGSKKVDIKLDNNQIEQNLIDNDTKESDIFLAPTQKLYQRNSGSSSPIDTFNCPTQKITSSEGFAGIFQENIVIELHNNRFDLIDHEKDEDIYNVPTQKLQVEIQVHPTEKTRLRFSENDGILQNKQNENKECHRHIPLGIKEFKKPFSTQKEACTKKDTNLDSDQNPEINDCQDVDYFDVPTQKIESYETPLEINNQSDCCQNKINEIHESISNEYKRPRKQFSFKKKVCKLDVSLATLLDAKTTEKLLNNDNDPLVAESLSKSNSKTTNVKGVNKCQMIEVNSEPTEHTMVDHIVSIRKTRSQKSVESEKVLKNSFSTSKRLLKNSDLEQINELPSIKTQNTKVKDTRRKSNLKTISHPKRVIQRQNETDLLSTVKLPSDEHVNKTMKDSDCETATASKRKRTKKEVHINKTVKDSDCETTTTSIRKRTKKEVHSEVSLNTSNTSKYSSTVQSKQNVKHQSEVEDFKLNKRHGTSNVKNENVRILRNKSKRNNSEINEDDTDREEKSLIKKLKLETPQLSSPQRNQRKSKVKIVFTMMKNPNIYESYIKQINGQVVDTVDACTVLVTERVQRSAKLLTAVGSGKPICSPQWIMDSKQFKAFLDPWENILIDPEAEEKWDFSLKQSLERSKSKKLLESYYFHIAVTQTADVLKDAIESCGGKIITKIPANNQDNTYIVSRLENETKYKKIKKNHPNIKVIEAEAIFDSVLRQEIRFSNHYLP